MKIKTALIVLAFTLAVHYSFAIEPETAVKKAINDEVTYPDFAIKALLEGVVYVIFTIDETGSISVQESNSLCEELRCYVVEKLDNLTITPDPVHKGKTYSMKFTFKLTE